MSSLLDEYNAVRNDCGVYILDDEAVLAISGIDRLSWLQGMMSNDVRLLERSTTRVLEACILNNTGHLLSDITLFNLNEDEAAKLLDLSNFSAILMMLPQQNVDKITKLLDRYIIMEDVEIRDVTTQLFHISIQGRSAFPDAGLISFPLNRLGSGGFDVFSREELESTKYGISISQETLELLRIEAGQPKYGVDMDERTIPIEANLESTHISLNKGCYVGQEIVARINSRGHTNRGLYGIVVESGEFSVGDELIPDESKSGESVHKDAGRITSLAKKSPVMAGKTIGLATIRHEFASPGFPLRSKSSGAQCTVHTLPFYSTTK